MSHGLLVPATMTYLAVALLLGVVISSLQADQSTPISPAAQANHNFTINILKKLVRSGNNILFSPLSISSVLALTSLGAKGNTRREIEQVLQYDLFEEANSSASHHVYQNLVRKLTSRHDGTNVSIASAFFVNRLRKVFPKFREQAQKFYDTEFHTMNDDPVAQINQWVAQHTNNMIKDMASPGSITPELPVALINAVHFKANWLHPFGKHSTKLMDFHVRKSQKVQVPMMYMEDGLPVLYNKGLNSHVVELPYGGQELSTRSDPRYEYHGLQPFGDFSMYIFLPVKKYGLTRLIKSLTTDNLMMSLKDLQWDTIGFWLPKFKFDLKFPLANLLKKLGIKQLFCKPDLSRMSPDPSAIPDILHGAAIDVNEEGTEAAASTGIFATSSNWKPPQLKSDHPFLFFIIHNPTNVILFAGGVFNPAIA